MFVPSLQDKVNACTLPAGKLKLNNPYYSAMSTAPVDSATVDKWLRWSEQVCKTIHHGLKQVTLSNKVFAWQMRNWYASFNQFQPKKEFYSQNICLSQGCHKLSHQYIRAYKVLHCINKWCNLLPGSTSSLTPWSFHKSHLMPAIQSLLAEGIPLANAPGPLEISIHSVYSNKAILYSQCRKGKLHHLSNRQGYGPDESSWILAQHDINKLQVQHCDEPNHNPDVDPERTLLTDSAPLTSTYVC